MKGLRKNCKRITVANFSDMRDERVTKSLREVYETIRKSLLTFS